MGRGQIQLMILYPPPQDEKDERSDTPSNAHSRQHVNEFRQSLPLPLPPEIQARARQQSQQSSLVAAIAAGAKEESGHVSNHLQEPLAQRGARLGFLPSPSSTPWALSGLVSELVGPSPGCTLTAVADQQLQPEESPELFDMDQTTFYDAYSPAKGQGLASEGAEGMWMMGPVKAEPLEPVPSPEVEMQAELVPEEVQEQLMNALSSDIAHDCAVLNIHNDPSHWSVADVQSWVEWIAAKQLLTGICKTNFALPGSMLCNMTEEQFRYLDPQNGPSLYTSFSIWKIAVQLNREREARVTYHPHSRVPSPPNSPLSGDSGDSQPPDTDGSDGSLSPLPLPRTSVASDEEDLRLPEGSDHKQTIHLWQFLKELLVVGERYRRYIKWLDRSRGIFKIEDSIRVAKLWGMRKNRPAMNYDKLSRSIRQYYKKGIIKKTEHSKRLVYQFCAPYL